MSVEGRLGPVWSGFVRLYWLLALVPLLGIPVISAYPSSLLFNLSLVYWISLPLLYFGFRRYPKLGAEIHLFLAYISFLLALSDVTAHLAGQPTLSLAWRNGIGVFGVMGLLGMAILGGWTRGVPAFAMLVLFVPDTREVPLLLVVASFLLTLMAGIAVHQIIHNLERAYVDLARAARIDPLTQLGNRRALEEDHARLPQRPQPSPDYLLMFDLDGLKQINDREGHLAGDRMLRDFARVLSEEISQPLGLYRTGGDEFCAMVRAQEDPRALGRRISLRFEQVSWGYAPISPDLDEALRMADRQMYQDKGRKSGQRGP